MKVAVVGATGLVGRKMIQVLEERNFPLTRIFAVASEKSAGGKIPFKQSEIEVISPEKALDAKPDIALFSAGATVSEKWALKFSFFQNLNHFSPYRTGREKNDSGFGRTKFSVNTYLCRGF